jgi:hypothetical protein
MNAPNDNTAPKGLRGWWASPPRSGARRWINPWEYRHLRASGATRFAGGSVLAFGGVLLLSYGAHGWAALFLVLGALNLGGGIWYLTVARSEPART